MMLAKLRRSISNKLMLVVMATTAVATLTYGLILLVHDIRTYRDSLLKDLATQANIIAEVSAPALEFNDPATAKENLYLLRTRPGIISAAIYSPDGQRFAQYRSLSASEVAWPEAAVAEDEYEIDGNQIHIWRPIEKNAQLIGSVFILARYEIQARMASYAIILGLVMAASMGLATLVAIWMRGALTKPILAVTDVARKVMTSRDYTLRARKYTEDEIGVLADAFNDMLDEVERRATALEAFNRSLEHEMSERLAAENALRQADRRKDEFLATLAHELRNPLAPLMNSLRILRLPEADATAVAYANQVMERQLRQMVRLVDDLLDVSRIATGKLAINKSPVNLCAVMDDAIEASRALIETCGHEFTVSYPPRDTIIEADAVRLAQVFSNLLNNAAKYTPAGGKLTFTGRLQGDRVLLEVQDDGIGIDADKLELIFGMFTQVDNTLERAYSGLGVGLALAKHLIEMHDGHLRVASDGRDCGSSFTVSLKLDERKASPEPAAATDTATMAEVRRVLLVDDNVDYIKTLAALLENLGQEVRMAFSGQEALEVARQFRPTHIFMDIGMPGMHGYDVARQMRADPLFDEVIIVAVTGWGSELDRRQSQDAGFDRHLVKPIRLEQLLEELKQTRERKTRNA